MSDVSRETVTGSEEFDTTPPAAPSGAAAVFGDRMPSATRFVEILADTGVTHGLIGPREVPRLWERHVLNCAVIEDAFPQGATLIDVGSGAGLPGVALAIARPDLDIHLVEPMQRRTDWLTATVGDLEPGERHGAPRAGRGVHRRAVGAVGHGTRRRPLRQGSRGGASRSWTAAARSSP